MDMMNSMESVQSFLILLNPIQFFNLETMNYKYPILKLNDSPTPIHPIVQPAQIPLRPPSHIHHAYSFASGKGCIRNAEMCPTLPQCISRRLCTIIQLPITTQSEAASTEFGNLMMNQNATAHLPAQERNTRHASRQAPQKTAIIQNYGRHGLSKY